MTAKCREKWINLTPMNHGLISISYNANFSMELTKFQAPKICLKKQKKGIERNKEKIKSINTKKLLKYLNNKILL